jgi:uncharacterized OB-fold protein
MSEQDSVLQPFAPNIFDVEDGRMVLLGGLCEACGHLSFPRATRCAHDGGAVAVRSLGGTGSLYSFTAVHVRPPFGLPAPYGLGYVDLDAVPLRVMMLLDPAHLDALAIGSRLQLQAAPMGVNLAGELCVRPYFTPAGRS